MYSGQVVIFSVVVDDDDDDVVFTNTLYNRVHVVINPTSYFSLQ